MEMKTYTSQPIYLTRYIPFDIGNFKKSSGRIRLRSKVIIWFCCRTTSIYCSGKYNREM